MNRKLIILAILLISSVTQAAEPVVESVYTDRKFPKKDQKAEHDYIAVLLADTGNVWRALFKQYGVKYEEPRIVIYAGETDSLCGKAKTVDGPFYCPANKTLYLEPGFLFTLRNARKLPGNFAVAYSIAHEVGHHVQNEWGILAQLGRMPEPQNTDDYEVIPQKLEMMADCLAGVWASKQKGKLDQSTIKTGITLASEIEALYPPKREDGVVIAKPRSHAETKERIEWFTKGYQGGAMTSCNTFWEN